MNKQEIIESLLEQSISCAKVNLGGRFRDSKVLREVIEDCEYTLALNKNLNLDLPHSEYAKKNNEEALVGLFGELVGAIYTVGSKRSFLSYKKEVAEILGVDYCVFHKLYSTRIWSA